jgi:hypothetical protein
VGLHADHLVVVEVSRSGEIGAWVAAQGLWGYAFFALPFPRLFLVFSGFEAGSAVSGDCCRHALRSRAIGCTPHKRLETVLSHRSQRRDDVPRRGGARHRLDQEMKADG